MNRVGTFILGLLVGGLLVFLILWPMVPRKAAAKPIVSEEVKVPKEEGNPKSIFGFLNSTPTPTPTPEPPPIPTLKWVHEGHPLPEAWVSKWEEKSGMKLVQVPMDFSTPASWPADGDLYCFQPRHFNILAASVRMKSIEQQDVALKVAPYFTGYPYDLNNARCWPWRWSPYLKMKSTRSNVEGGKSDPGLWKSGQSVLPNDGELFSAWERMENGMPANAGRKVAGSEVMPASIHARYGSYKECWELVSKGDAAITILPAAYRLMPPAGDDLSVAWLAPVRGTLIYLELLAIREDSPRAVEAESLAEYLNSDEIQRAMMKESGYFPCSFAFAMWKECPLPLPGDGKWFEASEFLLPRPLAPGAEATPEPDGGSAGAGAASSGQ